MAEPVKCNVSLQELEKYRDKEGFINLDELNLELTEASREKVGNEDRIKNWVDFAGTEVLIKGECESVLDNKRNAQIYAELIVEELAKQAGFDAAYYDLIKINGKAGVLSKKMLQKEEVDLITLYSLIGDTQINEEYPDKSDYIEVEEKLYNVLKEEGMNKKDIMKIIKEYRKQTAFFIMVSSLDRHAENVSFLSYINHETNKKELRLSPIYDNESSLMLDIDLETLEKRVKDGLGLQKDVDALEPKIAVLDGEYESPWKDTLELLCDDEEVYDFIMDCCDNLNIEKAIEQVGRKIKAPVPEIVKTTATYVFQFRKNAIKEIIYPQVEDIGISYTEGIINKSINEEIRQGEEDEILRKLFHMFEIGENNYQK